VSQELSDAQIRVIRRSGIRPYYEIGHRSPSTKLALNLVIVATRYEKFGPGEPEFIPRASLAATFSFRLTLGNKPLGLALGTTNLLLRRPICP
jgi:hypothetical protein